MSKSVFSDDHLSRLYGQHRPSLSEQVFQAVVKHCSRQTAHSTTTTTHHHLLALDIGCGSGNNTVPLVKYFSQVIGIDSSQHQISQAPKDVPGLSFRVAQAEDLPFIQSGSVDLINLVSAINWLDLDRFYPEADRVLKPGGTMTVVNYFPASTRSDNPGIQRYIRHLYREFLKDYWPPGLLEVYLSEFREFPAPYGPWIRNEEMVLDNSWSLEQIVNFLRSASGVQNYQQQHPEKDFAREMEERIRDGLSQEDISTRDKLFKVQFPVLVMSSQKPAC